MKLVIREYEAYKVAIVVLEDEDEDFVRQYPRDWTDDEIREDIFFGGHDNE